jgi:hypothetical protein
MAECICGKLFENDISCARHKSTCKIYRGHLKLLQKDAPSYLEEGVDHIRCRICSYRARDITRHLTEARLPHISIKEYRIMYPDQKLVCSQVEGIRKQTNTRLHGNPNYRNEEAQRAGVKEAFRSNPEILQGIRETKLERYGNAGYVNVEKRKQTLLEKYGVDNAMKVPEIKERAMRTTALLYADNPIERKPLIEKEILWNLHCVQHKTLKEIGDQLGYTEAVISYWMKKHGLLVLKKIVVPKIKEFERPSSIAKEYLEICQTKAKILSFEEFGAFTEDRKKQRLKRLFNAGRPYSHLKEELFSVALYPERWDEFLKKFI